MSGKYSKNIEFRRMQAEAVLALTRIRRRTEQRVTELLVSGGLADITPAQANAMMVLFQAKTPMTASQLATGLAVSEVTVARFVKALEAGAWVERSPSPNDGRAWLLQPTQKAYDALPNFVRVSNTMLDETFTGFERNEIERLLESIGRVCSNLEC